MYYAYSKSQSAWRLSWTTTRREALPVSSSRSAVSRAALKRVSMYSLAKGLGTEIVRYSYPTATALTSPNHTRIEEASISPSASPSACSSRRAQSSSAAGSGGGGGGDSVWGASFSVGTSAAREA